MSESNVLEYLFVTHKGQVRSTADLVALYIHSCMLDRKAKLSSGSAVLPEGWNTEDPIRLNYETVDGVMVEVVVAETAGDIFVTITENRKQNVASMAFGVNDFCHLEDTFEASYPDLETLRSRFTNELWNVVFPPPPRNQEQQYNQPPEGTNPRADPRWADDGRPSRDAFRPPAFDYGRSDLDPFGLGSNPLGGPLGGPMGGGGMLLDPRRGGRGFPDTSSGLPHPLPPGAVPPGARFDPFGPPMPGQGGRRPRGPDPDHASPPGWDNMFM